MEIAEDSIDLPKSRVQDSEDLLTGLGSLSLEVDDLSNIAEVKPQGARLSDKSEGIHVSPLV